MLCVTANFLCCLSFQLLLSIFFPAKVWPFSFSMQLNVFNCKNSVETKEPAPTSVETEVKNKVDTQSVEKDPGSNEKQALKVEDLEKDN